jgi:NADH:ubiquinone reductase (H+-translocating)
MRVVIVGGGFAAVKFAKTLRSQLKAQDCEIVLFNRENHMVFHPLLADVAGASLNPDAAAAPLRQMLPGVSCRTERVQRIDLDNSSIEFVGDSGRPEQWKYDHVVLACGAESNLGIIPGMTEQAFPFKVMRDAIYLRHHILNQMEKAEAALDDKDRAWHLSFIVVGAGFSGTEVAGELNELVRSSTRFYRNFQKKDVSVTMVHSQDQILPEVSPKLREFARKKMEKAGINIVLNARAVAATPEGVQLQDGRMLRGGTIVCTIGTAPSHLVQALNVPKEHGRIRTTPDMRIEGRQNAWALGDCAYIINAFDNKPSATTGQFAERQGGQAAHNLVRLTKGEPTKPFSFQALGQLCSIGGYEAVAEMFGFHISGFIAWFLWRGVYLFKLPTWSRRFKVALDWAWDLIFPRDLGVLSSETRQEFTHAYYRPGDFIQRQGDFAQYFSMIEEGEVEILDPAASGSEPKLIAVLGKGDFFGEEALLGKRPHQKDIRARTAVRLRQADSALFHQLAGTFSAFEELLSKAIVSSSGDFWNRMSEVKSLLEREQLSTFLEPLTQPFLHTNTTLADAMGVLEKSASGQLVILDDKQHLWGKLDRGDFQQIVARIAVTPGDKRGDIDQRSISEFLNGTPLYVTQEDSLLSAYSTMVDHGLPWLPVLRSKQDPSLVASVRAEKIANHLIRTLAEARAAAQSPVTQTQTPNAQAATTK